MTPGLSALEDREILYFVFADGCAACEAARPELAKFKTKHPSTMVLEVRADGPFPQTFGLKIRATPTYAFRHGAEMVKIDGAMRAQDIEKWVKKIGGAL